MYVSLGQQIRAACATHYHERMLRTTPDDRRKLQRLPRAELVRHQLARLNDALNEILPHNRFYAEKFARTLEPPLTSLEQLAQLPFTFKDELVTAKHGDDFAANLTYPLERYVRYHHTSGTRGRQMPVLDTTADWQGGSVAAIREQIESSFGATLIDHAGATEVGPWGFGDREGRGLFVIETEFIAEFRSLATGEPAADGEIAELIITTLGRSGS